MAVRGGERTRARELQRAAAELFFTKGYEATTIREIADALDIKSASIYYHWKNKETILFDLIRSTMEQLTAGVRSVLETEVRPDRQLAPHRRPRDDRRRLPDGARTLGGRRQPRRREDLRRVYRGCAGRAGRG